MSGYSGVPLGNDPRFGDKMKRLKKSMKFPSELSQKVDVRRVRMEVIREWVERRITELLGGLEDDFLIEYIQSFLEKPDLEGNIDGKDMQISLTGFLEKNTSLFMRELWGHLLSAMQSPAGIPQSLLDSEQQKLAQVKAQREAAFQHMQQQQALAQTRGALPYGLTPGRGPSKSKPSRWAPAEGDEAQPPPIEAAGAVAARAGEAGAGREVGGGGGDGGRRRRSRSRSRERRSPGRRDREGHRERGRDRERHRDRDREGDRRRERRDRERGGEGEGSRRDGGRHRSHRDRRDREGSRERERRHRHRDDRHDRRRRERRRSKERDSGGAGSPARDDGGEAARARASRSRSRSPPRRASGGEAKEGGDAVARQGSGE
ncbi:unnamed protein product [Pedinophyceae sp. YPF-701]|nr:unnamed protein product [Pedinophyceae sp. YPF-701]